VGAGNVEVSQRVVDVVCRALAEALPHRVGGASQGTMNNVLIGGEGPSGHWVYYETVAGGQGGRPPRPGVPGAAPMAGMSGVHTGMTNTLNTPVEALERAFHLRVLRYRLRSGSGGAGAASGGDGIERDLQVVEDRMVRRERTGCCPTATSPVPSACPTSAPCNCVPATCCGCSPRAAAAGASPDSDELAHLTVRSIESSPCWNSMVHLQS
jgi:hypothetical protein